jgi:hypothetical protein
MSRGFDGGCTIQCLHIHKDTSPHPPPQFSTSHQIVALLTSSPFYGIISNVCTGQGVGARYDGSYPGSTYHGPCNWQNDIDQWDDWYKDQTRGYIEVQLEAYLSKTQGFFFWNFKTEGAAEWDLFKLLDAGVFPNPVNQVSSRKWGDQCSQF